MNELKLSERLQTVAEEIPVGEKMADIGSDHAYLPSYLCITGRVTHAIAGEVADGPFASAIAQVKTLGLEGSISVRKGDGLDILSPGEVESIVIAGMGGKLIRDILERGKEKLEGVNRLILQPNVASEIVRCWLKDNGWELKKETILEEDEKIYEILTADRGDGHAPYRDIGEAGYRFGPFLLKEKNEVFRKKWKAELDKWRLINRQMARADETKEIAERRKQMKKKILEMEEILNGEDG
ncbi:MAG TPA: tRNA (adenine(22)-N(1))-methyltransferase TrmK [Bacillales bacterium]|nr:tRNA (adenine(22)-N(1))-methyltransferase TrmK [Bacillales bacterium]